MKSQGYLDIRLIPHNIRYATAHPFQGEKPWAIRFPRLTSELCFHAAHNQESLICLQEVLHHQLNDILHSLNYGSDEWRYIGVGRDDGREAGEYSPLFYRPGVWKLLLLIGHLKAGTLPPSAFSPSVNCNTARVEGKSSP